MNKHALILTMGGALVAGPVMAQTNSLYQSPQGLADQANERFEKRGLSGEPLPSMNRNVALSGLYVVKQSEPRAYRVHDLVTIIVQEDFTSSSDADLSTEKETTVEGEISEFPRLTLADLVEFQLGTNLFPDGNPQLGVEFSREFEGAGEFSRRDTMSGRITARVVDVKPNGTLVLEARKTLQSDNESVSIVAVGTCRAEDISPTGNTILSTHLYDLNITKRTHGALRKAAKKGFLTKIMDAVFGF